MRYSGAYRNLVSGLNEVRLIEREALKLEQSNAIENGARIFALVRGGVVLLTSHLEAYVKGLVEVTLQQIHLRNVGIENLPKRFLYFTTQDLIREIGEANDPEKIGDKILSLVSRDGANIRASGPLVSAINWEVFEQGFSTPKFKQIAKYLKRVGYSSLNGDLAAMQRSQHQIIINAVDHLVDTRNAIAHGDQSARKTPAELSELIGQVQVFCRNVDDAYCTWCKGALCTIRV